jgi:hypothetical protein
MLDGFFDPLEQLTYVRLSKIFSQKANSTLKPKLYHIMAQDIRAMLRSGACGALDSRNQLVAFLYDFTQWECGIILFTQTLGSVFDVRKMHSKAKQGCGRRLG